LLPHLRSAMYRARIDTPKFLAVHVMPTPTTFAEGNLSKKKVKANITVDAYRVLSVAQLNQEGKIARATNIEAIRKVLPKIPKLPTEESIRWRI